MGKDNYVSNKVVKLLESKEEDTVIDIVGEVTSSTLGIVNPLLGIIAGSLFE